MDSEPGIETTTSTYVTSSGAELEVSYDKGRTQLPYITNEVRYRMRNIPFFCIPPCESKAYDPKHVKAKVDTRNTGYVPKRPWSSESSRSSTSSPQKPRWDSSPLSKSFSNGSSSTPPHLRTTPNKMHGSPTKRETRETGSSASGDVITFSAPRRGSGASNGKEINVASKTRKTPSQPDYSHVKSKIRTCWELKDKFSGDVGAASEKSSNSSVGSSPTTPRRRSREGTEVKVTRKTSIGFKVADYSHITARVDSNRKISSGTDEDIVRKINKSRDGAKNDQVDGKPATPKSVRQLNNDGIGQKRGTADLKSPPKGNMRSTGLRGSSIPVRQGGRSKQTSAAEAQRSPTQKMPSTYTVNSPRNRYANVKAKVDTSDPNPAHKLRRNISDLTIKEGVKINPRFANVPLEKAVPRKTDLSQSFPKDKRSFSRIKGERAIGIRSPFTKERPTSELVSREKMPSMRRGMGNQNSALKKREIPAPIASTQTADILREVEADNMEEVVDKEVQSQALNSEAFSEEPNVSFKEEEEEAGAGIGISGIEVSNNETETTVVLKHILALSGRNGTTEKSQTPSPVAGDLAIVEEDELGEEYYESKDEVKPPSEIPSSYSLPHLIPRLIVTDEDKELVETVVSEPRKLEATGEDKSQSVEQKYTIAPSRLQIFVEEDEEDEDPSSTHL